MHVQASPAELAAFEDWGKPVDIEIKDGTLDDALGVLFQGTDITYEVDPEVAGLKVNAMVKNVSRMSALQEILKAAGVTMAFSPNSVKIRSRQPAIDNLLAELERKRVELTAKLAGERVDKTDDHEDVRRLQAMLDSLMTEIEMAKDLQSRNLNFRQSWADNLSSPGVSRWFDLMKVTSEPVKTRVFGVEYLNPAELVPVLHAIGARQVTVIGADKLIVNATEKVLDEVNEAIAGMDQETSLPKPIIVHARARYVFTRGSENPEVVEASTSGTVAEGQPINLRIAAGPEMLLDLNVVPEIVGDKTITLFGSASHPSIYDGQPSNTMSTPVAMSVVPGVEAVIASGKIDGSGDKLEYTISVTVSIGEGRLKMRSYGEGGFFVPGVGNFGAFGGGQETESPSAPASAGEGGR